MKVTFEQFLYCEGVAVTIVIAGLCGLALWGRLMGWIPPCRDNG